MFRRKTFLATALLAIATNSEAALAQGAPRLSSLEPWRGPGGTKVVLHGTGFTNSNTVHFGIGGAAGVPSSGNGTRITYTIPNAVSPCDLVASGGPACMVPALLVQPGSYQISVTNERGRSRSLQFEVTARTR